MTMVSGMNITTQRAPAPIDTMTITLTDGEASSIALAATPEILGKLRSEGRFFLAELIEYVKKQVG